MSKSDSAATRFGSCSPDSPPTRNRKSSQLAPVHHLSGTTIYYGVLDANCKNLLRCAEQLRRHDILLRICAQLRETGAHDDVTRKLEVQLLSQYQPERSLELAKKFQQYDAKYFTAASNLIALRLGYLDQIDLAKERLPGPDELRVEESRLVVVAYLATKRFDDAIKFLYEQLRLNFNNPRAHINYFWVIMLHGSEAQILKAPKIVDHGSSALLENTTSNERRWVTIESDEPDVGRDEFDESNPIVLAILGRRVNDLIDVPGRLIQPQQERIAEIQTKYLRLFQDIRDQFQHRFPGETFMQTMSLGSGENLDPTPLIKTLEDRRRYVTEVMQFYRNEQVCSLHLLASRLGINELQLVKGLMADDSHEIRCVNCEPKQLEELAAQQLGKHRYVLDISAIITLSELDAWDSLDAESVYFASRTTLDLLSEWIDDLYRNPGNERGTAFVTDEGQLVIQNLTVEDINRQRDELRQIYENVKKRCVIESSGRIAELAPDRRDLYIDFFGYHTLEAMCVAKDKDAILWTDDFVVGSLIKFEFDVDRVWTQLQLKVSFDDGLIDTKYFERATAKLLGWKYINTMWNGRTLLCAGELSSWDVNRWPFKQCLQLIGLSPWPLLEKARVIFEFFQRLRESTSTSSQDAQIPSH